MHKDGGCREEESNIMVEVTGKQRELQLEAKDHTKDCIQLAMMLTRIHPVYHVIMIS